MTNTGVVTLVTQIANVKLISLSGLLLPSF